MLCLTKVVGLGASASGTYFGSLVRCCSGDARVLRYVVPARACQAPRWRCRLLGYTVWQSSLIAGLPVCCVHTLSVNVFPESRWWELAASARMRLAGTLPSRRLAPRPRNGRSCRGAMSQAKPACLGTSAAIVRTCRLLTPKLTVPVPALVPQPACQLQRAGASGLFSAVVFLG